MFKVMALEGGTFGRCLGHESRALIDGIDTLIKEASERCEIKGRRCQLRNRKRAHTNGPDHADALILDLQPPEQ